MNCAHGNWDLKQIISMRKQCILNKQQIDLLSHQTAYCPLCLISDGTFPNYSSWLTLKTGQSAYWLPFTITNKTKFILVLSGKWTKLQRRVKEHINLHLIFSSRTTNGLRSSFACEWYPWQLQLFKMHLIAVWSHHYVAQKCLGQLHTF